MRRVKSRDTQPELLVRTIIRSMGLHYRLHSDNLPGCPDIVFASRKKAIFVHGCFWHRHSNCKRAAVPHTRKSYWLRKFERNRTRDEINSRKLRRRGWKVLTVWECQLRNRDLLTKRIATFLNARDAL
jgi:DNA mismatch endonuclease, patch repair protein